MEKQVITTLIQKFLAGKCAPDEIEQLENWWQTASEDERYMDRLSAQEQEIIKEHMLKNIQLLIQAHEAQVHATSRVAKDNIRKLNPFTFEYFKLAAACLVMALVASGIFLLLRSTEVHIVTAYGERREVVLPDQSTVVLNGNSSLRYTPWREDEDRMLWLTGEAFFAVKHTTNHNRFVVHTENDLKVEVLGTQFTVNNRNGITDVVLKEGEVKLRAANVSYTMKPDEMVRYSKGKPAFVTQQVNAKQRVAWKDNLLIFQDETVESIVTRLTETYGVRVIFFNETVKAELFNGSIPGDSVDLFFDKISKLYAVKIERLEDGVYVIK